MILHFSLPAEIPVIRRVVKLSIPLILSFYFVFEIRIFACTITVTIIITSMRMAVVSIAMSAIVGPFGRLVFWRWALVSVRIVEVVLSGYGLAFIVL